MALDLSIAKPKSMSFTLNGCLLWFNSMMLSSFKSVWISPIPFRAFNALATCKWSRSQNINQQSFKFFLSSNSAFYLALTSLMIILMPFKGIGSHFLWHMYSWRVLSSISNTMKVRSLLWNHSWHFTMWALSGSKHLSFSSINTWA